MDTSFRFLPYEESDDIANIVVDGSPNRSTVLTLTHWPAIRQPPGLCADLSAEMAFNYLDSPVQHVGAEVVTNNHFDQDGLVGLHALIEPELSQLYRDRLIDVAAAGDFGSYRFRDSARASMAIWAYAQPDYSPLGDRVAGPYEQTCAVLYETVLPLLVPMVEDPTRFKELWAKEDASLEASEEALADGLVTIEEDRELDLAIVHVTAEQLAGGHRFASDSSDFMHPFALNNATRCCRILMIRGREYLYLDRYETWVQYQTRELPKRVDLGPLCEQLESRETGSTSWTASRPSSLTPTLRSNDNSTIDAESVRAIISAHLRTAPSAWDPFHLRQAQ